MEQILESCRRFYGSRYYPIIIALLVLIGYTTELELILCGVLVASVIFGLLICCDLRFLIMPLLSAVFMIPLQGEREFAPIFDRYLSDARVLRYLIILSVLLVLAFFGFIFKNRRCVNQISKDRILLSMLLFCGAVALGGTLSNNGVADNLVILLMLVLSMPTIYALLGAFLRFDRSLIDYVIFCLIGCGLIVCAELLFTCMTSMQIVDGQIVKESMILGWGSWTNVGNMLLMIMPVCFYVAVSHPRGWIGYWLGVLHFFFLVLCQSRGALLCGGITFLACVVYVCLFGENRKQNRAFTVGLILAFALTVLLAPSALLRLIQNFLSFGFFDNGRFALWSASWNSFLQNPVFGVGFYHTCDELGSGYAGLPSLSHNTVLQLLGSCGIAGMAAYAYHRYITIKVFVSKFDHLTFFMGMSVLGFLLFGLLDVPMFTVYPNFYYALMLLIAERGERQFASR